MKGGQSACLLYHLYSHMIVVPRRIHHGLSTNRNRVINRITIRFPIRPIKRVETTQIKTNDRHKGNRILLRVRISVISSVTSSRQVTNNEMPHRPITVLLRRLSRGNLLLLLNNSFANNRRVVIVGNVGMGNIGLNPLYLLT